MNCNADVLGSSARCTLDEGHTGWHQEWYTEEDGISHLQEEWKYTRKEERALGEEYWKWVQEWEPGH